MDEFSITQHGKPLGESLYTIDIRYKIFATLENNLVLDFGDLNGWTFKAFSGCTFKTGANCTFNTGGSCTFNTDWNCTFHTYHTCTFETGGGCSFSLYDIDSCKFKNYDGHSTIFDRIDNKRYVLSAELIKMLKIKNG